MLPDPVRRFIDAEISANRTDFGDVRAAILNGTLKRSRETSHTDGLIAITAHVLTRTTAASRPRATRERTGSSATARIPTLNTDDSRVERRVGW